jgi:PAS domain S-box-containing protein
MAQVFDATTDAIVFLDRNYTFTFLNRRARELLLPGGEVLGKNLFDRFPGVVYENSPYVENYRRSMDHGEPREFEAYYAEPLNLWFRIQSYPTDDGIVLFFRDVTQERLAQEELQRKREEAERQHAEIDTVYRTAPIGLALFDTKDYRYLRLNERQAAFFGLKPEEIVGRTLTEMAPIEGLKELFDQVMRGEPVVNYPLEGTVITDPDVHRYWTVSYFPVYAADGSIRAITAASLEITQQKKAEEALIQSEKLAAVGRLASSIAHEINNPLEAVTNLLYLSRNSDDLRDIQEYLQTAEIELRRVSAIANQTLRFHKQSSSPQAIKPEQLLESVISVYQGRIANSAVRISQRDRANIAVRCFEGEIRQVLSNLVGNALDAMNSGGGRLYLRTRRGTHWKSGEAGVFITVADTGTGMSAATREKLFNPFFTTKGVTGTGLGLWLSKEMIDRHRGALRMRSSQSPKHRGTVFSIFLPFDAVIR